ELKLALQQQGGDLIVRHGKASSEIPKLAEQLKVNAVFTNRDYEPSAAERDSKVACQLKDHAIEFHDFKDQVIFEKDEILTQAGKPFGVFTPYKNAVLKKLNDFYLASYPVSRYINNLVKRKAE